MDETCVSNRPLSETAVLVRLNAPNPQTIGRPSGATSARSGVSFVARFTAGVAGRHAMVVAHVLFESASDAVYVGAESRAAPLIGRRSSAGSKVKLAAIDEKAAGPRRLGSRGPGFPHREPALPRRHSRSRVREAQDESSFGAGWIAASCGRRTGCIGEAYP